MPVHLFDKIFILISHDLDHIELLMKIRKFESWQAENIKLCTGYSQGHKYVDLRPDQFIQIT